MADAPFLLLSVRGEDEAADDEYQAMMRFAGVDEPGMHRIRLTHTPLGEVDLSQWSGVILGGGPYNVSDEPAAKSPTQLRVETELAGLLAAIIDRDFPFLGCCYGVGTVGTAIGAVVDRSHPEPVGPVTVDTLSPSGDASSQVDPITEGWRSTLAASIPSDATSIQVTDAFGNTGTWTP